MDKREHARVSVRMLVVCEREGAPQIDGLATNISLGGSRIESADVPPFGTALTIVTRLPGETEMSRLQATVRWTASSAFGVQFGLLHAKDNYRIANLMSHSVPSR